jgi:hypothetical protein
MQGRERLGHYFAFCSNLGIMGGLMLLMLSGH